jgi:hypothetical protein
MNHLSTRRSESWLLFALSGFCLVPGLCATSFLCPGLLALACTSALVLVRHNEMGNALAESDLDAFEEHSGFHGMWAVVLLSVFAGTAAGALATIGLTGLLTSQAALRHDRQLLNMITDTLKAPLIREPAPQVEGITLMGLSDTSRTECPHCAICANSLGDAQATVTCLSCDTPYHEDCWTYNGRCAIYGCGRMYASHSYVAQPFTTSWPGSPSRPSTRTLRSRNRETTSTLVIKC